MTCLAHESFTESLTHSTVRLSSVAHWGNGREWKGMEGKGRSTEVGGRTQVGPGSVAKITESENVGKLPRETPTLGFGEVRP